MSVYFLCSFYRMYDEHCSKGKTVMLICVCYLAVKVRTFLSASEYNEV